MRASPLELELYVHAVAAAAAHQQERDHNLARMIIRELALALRKR